MRIAIVVCNSLRLSTIKLQYFIFANHPIYGQLKFVELTLNLQKQNHIIGSLNEVLATC